ncbi:Adenylylsulfate kinase family protein [Heracleum sosnowskyi]|uniref:Adenylylsulfate kinase family protein n=1 Tax=Heracleum sosnowskyi TaxID=360622 RepID=A0AAD8IK46_9APIA|nr:Adenylylsulfate kinase family protein [Heracleum sosnowskyi]
MDKSEKAVGCKIAAEADLLLKWGNRKRVRCVRLRDTTNKDRPSQLSSSSRLRRRITSRFLTFSDNNKPIYTQQSTRLTRNSEAAKLSPEKDDKHYSTRGLLEEKGGNGKKIVGGENEESKSKGSVWPKLYISLTSKEKEEDFMAMKGCKLPQRPKKRAKIIQRTLLLVSPGAWLTDLCQERYEVREKKTTKKRARGGGLKAMGSLESDSE